MNLKHINTFILLALFTLSATVSYNAITVDDYRERYRIFDDEPLFTDDLVIIEAEDGRKVHIRKLNPYYDENVRVPNKTYYVTHIGWQTFTENECYYLVLCKDEEHILGTTNQGKNYLRKHGDKITLEKHIEYGGVSSYFLTILGEEDKDVFYTQLVWFVDVAEDNFCSSFQYPYITESTGFVIHDIEDGYDYYKLTRDFFLLIIESEIERCTELQKLEADYFMSIESARFIRYVQLYETDEKLRDKLVKDMDFLGFWSNISMKRESANIMVRFPLHTQTVSEIKNEFLKVMGTPIETNPNIKGELPRTEEELEEFINWKIRSRPSGNPYITDSFGNPVKFEVVTEGLKVISAGKDGIFDTKDDQFFIRTYESAGM